MATHHPYSFSDPVEPTVARRRRQFQLSDERGRVAAVDSEAPATALDSDIEREESRAPLLIAGVTSAAILGGLLVVLGFFVGEPEMSRTAETETIPRQAAQLAKLDADALVRARMTTTAPSAPPAVQATGSASLDVPSTAPMSVDSGADSTNPAPMSAEPASVPEPAPEPIMTPAPSDTAPSIELDSDNPYTSEVERRIDAPAAPMSATPSEVNASDNPY